MRSTRIQTLITMEIEIPSIMMSSYLPKLFQAKARLCDLYNQMKNKSDQVVVDEFQSGSGTMRRRWKTMIGESILEKMSCIIFCSDLALTLLRPCSDLLRGFLVTVTLLRLISDPAPTSPTFLVTVTMFRPCSNLAPTFLVTLSQYYNSGHSLL